MSNITDIQQLAQQIRQATEPAENDANRVGLTLEKIATELQSQSDAATTEATARQQADTALQEQVEVKAEGEYYNLYDENSPVFNGYVNTNGEIAGGAATDNKYLYTKIPIESDTVYVLRMYTQSDSSTVYAAIQDKNGVALDIYNDSDVKYPLKYVSFVKVGRSFCVKATGEGLNLLVTVKFNTADYRELLFVGKGNVEPEDYIAHECLAVSPVKVENTSRFIYNPAVGATSSVLSYFDENNDFSSDFIVRRDRGVSGGVSECFNLVNNVLVNKTTNQRVSVGGMSDDICPYNGSLASYIGANHGIMQTYKCTVSGHGKTFADIGSLWNNGSYNFILADIIDNNNILLVSENQQNYPVWQFIEPTKTTYQHVEGAAHTSSFTVSNTAVLQGKPILKIEGTRIFVDGKEIENEVAKTYLFSSEVKICQNYMIANPASIIEKLRLNVGTFTDHPVFSELEDVDFFVKLSISYIYTDARHLYIATTLAFLQDTQNGYFGFSQFAPLQNPNSTRLYIPKLLPLNNPDYRTNPVFASAQNTSYPVNYWEDADKLPDRFIMTNDTTVYSAGYLFDIGIGGEKRKNFTGLALNIPTTRKLYFRGLDSSKVNLTSPDGNSSRAGEAYSMVVFRHYAPLADENKEAGVFLSNIFEYNNSLYIYIDFNAAGLYAFDIPAEYVGKEVEVYETRSNVKLLTKIASDTITVKVDEGTPMYGYLVAKIKK